MTFILILVYVALFSVFAITSLIGAIIAHEDGIKSSKGCWFYFLFMSVTIASLFLTGILIWQRLS